MTRARIAIVSSIIVIAFAACLPSIIFGQERERFVISARAGGVNAVTGRATVRSHGSSEWQQLTIQEDIGTGDMVRTGTDGRLEMLLNPGSYLRIGENSEFELADSSLEKLAVRLIRGTAVVEATGADDTPLLINITTPHTKLAIVRRGLYRLSVVPGDNTELIVRKGRVMLDGSQTKIKGGNKVVFNTDSYSVAKLQKIDKKKVDGLDEWSKERAGMVAQVNRKIRGREMSLLMSSLGNRWESAFSARSRGLWFFSQRYGCYTFIPFYYGWGSPYGNSYSNTFGCCGRPFYYGGTGATSYPPGRYPSSPSAQPSSRGPSASPSRPAAEPRSIPPASEGRGNRSSERLPQIP